MNLKKIFKTSTVAMTIISVVGCSTTIPQPTIYGYKLNDTRTETVIDENGKEVILDENHKIKTIKSTSEKMKRNDCESMQWAATTEVKLMIQRTSEPLIERTSNQSSRIYENKVVRMTVDNCESLEYTKDRYSFTITVDSLGDNVQTNETMKSIKKFFAKLGMTTLIVVGVILLIPVFIIGFVFISIPAMIFGLFTGGK